MNDVHFHFHFPPPGSEVLSQLQQLKELITMNNTELKTAIDGVATTLGQVGDQLTAGEAQLTKAFDELVVALSNAGNTTPAVDASLAALKAAADALAGKGAAIGTVAKSLDDLTPDVPPAP
jgi:uncharacterized protein involved in exopolysaccharide biosynthesis